MKQLKEEWIQKERKESDRWRTICNFYKPKRFKNSFLYDNIQIKWNILQVQLQYLDHNFLTTYLNDCAEA